MLNVYSDIVYKYWDYTKNTELPENISIKSDKEYWWKDETGSFLMKPIELRRKTFGTSFNEQCIYFYLSKIFKNIQSRKQIKCDNKNYEADIYLEDYKIAIEYDGVFWHKSKYDKDLEKTKHLSQLGIKVIHIREKGLKPIEILGSLSIMYDLKRYFNACINELCKLLLELLSHSQYKSATEIKSLHNFQLTEEQFFAEEQKILDQYRTNYIEENITKTCLIKYWDYNKNTIIPQKVSLNDDINIWIKCPYGFEKSINVKRLGLSHQLKCENTNCVGCKSFYCPFVTMCNTEKTYYYKTLCPNMKKYYYYNIIEECKNLKQFSYVSENCIGKVLKHSEDEYYNIYNIYKENKDLLQYNPQILSNIRQIFITSELHANMFDSLNELKSFLNFCRPIITKIDYKSFDVDEIHRDFLVDILEHITCLDYDWESIEGSVSDKFYLSIKNVMEKHFINMNTRKKTLQDIKSIVKEYNPTCTHIEFKDFDIDDKHRKFIFDYIKKNINYPHTLPLDSYKDISPSFLKMIPNIINMHDNFVAGNYIEEWNKNFYKLYGKKINAQKIEINKTNFNQYLEFNWNQHSNLHDLAFSFHQKDNNQYIALKQITIKYIGKNSDLIILNDADDKILTLNFDNSKYWHTTIYIRGVVPKFEKFPFEIVDVKGFVINYN